MTGRFVYLPSDTSRMRQREAQRARENRAEIVKARSIGEITKRDLLRWGIFTAAGTLALKNGLSPYAQSAFGKGATGAPRSPLFGAAKFTTPLSRLHLQNPVTLTPQQDGLETNAAFPSTMGELPSKRLSYHTDYSNWQQTGPDQTNPFRNPLTTRGPIEGRPPGEIFAHQRWQEFFPKKAYVMTLGKVLPNYRYHPNFAAQNENSCWCYGSGSYAAGSRCGDLPPPLFKLRYGEPVLLRVHNNLPVDRAANGGFGRNETQLHFHNAHNGAESDGAANVHHFPGTFYDYRWSTTLARRDKINTGANDVRASGPTDSGGLVNVAGDWRELQGSMWCHDHRFFFTAENVYKGNVGAVNMYSGPDRGNESVADGVNLRLPSGRLLPWGNIDFDVNLVFSDGATDLDGQYFFDIFTTDGFVGDIPLINFAYAPYMDVLPRKYRLRFLNASMSRFIKLALADSNGRAVPFQFIANDGNLVVNPIPLTELDQQGTAERYDIIVDFSRFRIGDRVRLVNLLQQTDGRKPDKAFPLGEALGGKSVDPAVGAIMEFRIAGEVQSVDVPGVTLRATDPDASLIPLQLTDQIPIVAPVRERVVEFGRSGGGDSRGANGQCTPDCSEVVQGFPWTIKVNGENSHSFNANRVSQLIPKPGEVEHWTYINGGGGWDHPIHLHFEEGITMNRGSSAIPATEKLVRKDVWRLRPSGRVQFQVQFGEFGGSYVNHCHNTVHEDFAMLMRIQLLTGATGERPTITSTPNPTPDGVVFTTPEILPEGNPANANFFNKAPSTTSSTTSSSSSTSGKLKPNDSTSSISGKFRAGKSG